MLSKEITSFTVFLCLSVIVPVYERTVMIYLLRFSLPSWPDLF